MYDQPDLEAVLRAAVAERDLVTLVPDTEVLDVLIEGDRVGCSPPAGSPASGACCVHVT